MPRELTTENLKVTFYDRISDSDLDLFYRLPTTKEQIAYDNSLVKRKRNKITNTIGETRMTYGKRILKGIGDDTFMVERDGELVPLHSRKDSEFYNPDWKDLVEEMAPDVISRLGFFVFEGSLEQGEGEDEDDKDDAVGDPT